MEDTLETTYAHTRVRPTGPSVADRGSNLLPTPPPSTLRFCPDYS